MRSIHQSHYFYLILMYLKGTKVSTNFNSSLYCFKSPNEDTPINVIEW